VHMKLPKSGLMHNALKNMFQVVFRLSMRIKANGLENLPDQPCIIAPNHQSVLDGFLVASFFKRRFMKKTYVYAKEKHFRGKFLRFVAEKNNIPAMIVINKVDLIGLEKAMEIFSIYPKLGYPLLLTSTRSGEGVEALRQKLLGRISAFAGPSGVGKTSLLNHIQPELGLKVREVYDHLDQKGRHTTNVREMFPIDGGGYVADLPGLRSLALWDTQPEELDGYFPELRGLVADCQFNDCTHRDEPGCAVIQALSAGRIDPERYKSYLKLRFGDRLI